MPVQDAFERVPEREEFAYERTVALAARKTPWWAGATPLFATCSWPKDHWGRSSPTNRTSRQYVSFEGAGFERCSLSPSRLRASSFLFVFLNNRGRGEALFTPLLHWDFTNHFTGGAEPWLGKSIRCMLRRGPSCTQTGTMGGRERPHPLTHRASRLPWDRSRLSHTQRVTHLAASQSRSFGVVRQR
jgi:hypothetical protein